MRFRKKPVTIDAIQWLGTFESYGKICSFTGLALQNNHNGESEPQELYIPTLEGEHVAKKGDWIIRGVKGEFYPCKPDIFELTYEQVSEGIAEVFDTKKIPTAHGSTMHGLGFR